MITRDEAIVVATELAVKQLLRLIDDLRDVTECWHDHHGYCQAHGWMATVPTCPHARAAALLPPQLLAKLNDEGETS